MDRKRFSLVLRQHFPKVTSGLSYWPPQKLQVQFRAFTRCFDAEPVLGKRSGITIIILALRKNELWLGLSEPVSVVLARAGLMHLLVLMEHYDVWTPPGALN